MQKTLIILMEKCLAKVSKILPIDDSIGQKIKWPIKWNLQSDMGGIFGFFLGVSMVSVVHSVQKFYDRVMTRLGIYMWLILRCENCVRTIFDALTMKHGQLIRSTLYNHSKLFLFWKTQFSAAGTQTFGFKIVYPWRRPRWFPHRHLTHIWYPTICSYYWKRASWSKSQRRHISIYKSHIKIISNVEIHGQETRTR